MSNTVERPVASDYTTGQITTPSGELAIKPTLLLSGTELDIIRAYRDFLERAHLEPELFCHDCFTGHRESMAVYEVTPEQVLIACRCRMRFGQAPSPSMTGAFIARSSEQLITPACVVDLARADAILLRQYQRVCNKYRLFEALRCRQCWALSTRDGLRARVTSASIRLECRCRILQYLGTT